MFFLDRGERQSLYKDEVERSDNEVAVADKFPLTAEMAEGINGVLAFSLSHVPVVAKLSEQLLFHSLVATGFLDFMIYCFM